MSRFRSAIAPGCLQPGASIALEEDKGSSSFLKKRTKKLLFVKEEYHATWRFWA
jgi:hypothetical protein